MYKRQQSVLIGTHVEEFDGSLMEEAEKKMQGVGFEPTPPKRIVPETTALDHSAILASIKKCVCRYKYLKRRKVCIGGIRGVGSVCEVRRGKKEKVG